MFSTLEVDIRPGSGLGPFELGSSLWDILDLLRRMQHVFPLVDVKYDSDSPTTPLMLHIRPHLDLLFSGYHQRLHTICLRGLRDFNPPVILRYKDSTLSSYEEVLRRVGVSRTFGPTYPGDDLRYPGVSFSFEEDGRSDGLKGATSQPEDRMQEVRRVFVTQKSPSGEVRDALGEVLESTTMDGEVRQAVVKVHDSVILHFYPSMMEPVRIRLGVSTAQDLTCELGPPIRVHYKEDDRMTIHSRSSSADDDVDSDYFYNYLQHGIDFLISGSTHLVKKIILHSNIPGTPLFQRYKRCPWEIEGIAEDDEDETPSTVKFNDRIEDMNRLLSPKASPPSMLLDRTDDVDGLTLPGSRTRLFGYDGVVLEATESAQVVAIMLY
ncbi:hypothetical protein BKA93DRAFT_723292 [Sparassis latifolia]|uniref:Uncharacterized protein n=1 Tax=Sparassis crispa TaxID=139825 RepID=A0A401GC04_9APHY|nr:hypothetical protein SCP_0208850 [Sparassis crispa]GBE79685.1 hypothetical protein SCP_0208850 [Sparassis crispa]